MNGIWIAVMAIALVAVGVAAQTGWELPISSIKEAIERRRAQRESKAVQLGDVRGPVVRPGL